MEQPKIRKRISESEGRKDLQAAGDSKKKKVELGCFVNVVPGTNIQIYVLSVWTGLF